MRRGLLPGVGGTWSISRRIGRRALLRWLLLDLDVDTATALEITRLEANHPYSMTEVVRDLTLRRLEQDLGLDRSASERLWALASQNHATVYVPGWVILDDREGQPVNRTVVLYDYHGVYAYKNAMEEFETEGDQVALLSAWVMNCRGITGEVDTLAGPVTEGRVRACNRLRRGITRLDDYGITQMTAAEVRRLFASDLPEEDSDALLAASATLFDDAAHVRTTLSGYLNNPDNPLWFQLDDRKHIWLLASELL